MALWSQRTMEVTVLVDKYLWHLHSLFKYRAAYLKMVKKHVLGTFSLLGHYDNYY